METSTARWRRWTVWLLAAGALLHGLLIWFPRPLDDDADVYAELGHNLLRFGTYGLMEDGSIDPSLFRLPGYPLFLALLGGHTWLVLLVQTLVDLLGCWLLGMLVRRCVSERAGLWTLGLSATCVFTAIYAAQVMTESLSVFAVALALWSLAGYLGRRDAFSARRSWRGLLPLAGACALAMLLRPDGALLTIAAGLALVWYGLRCVGWRAAGVTAALFGCLACVPLVPWTIRNAVVFHVFQPLAPRHVNDPGERVNLGFYRWMRTWAAEYVNTGEVYWHAGSETIRMSDLPERAMDSAAQRAQTADLLARYNVRKDFDQRLDDDFGRLADAKIRANPLRYYLGLPILRVADMWLRPRVDGTRIPADWQTLRMNRVELVKAIGLGLLNLLYVAAAVSAVLDRRTRRLLPVAAFMAIYVLLRCLLLGTMENAEPRYTLECYPMVLICAGVWFSEVRGHGRSELRREWV